MKRGAAVAFGLAVVGALVWLWSDPPPPPRSRYSSSDDYTTPRSDNSTANSSAMDVATMTAMGVYS